MSITNYEFHELCLAYPDMPEWEFAKLVEDIEKHGQQEDIVLLGGKILDGRHRYLACKKLNKEPRVCDYDGKDPAAFVKSLNLHRRHLTIEDRRERAADELKADPQQSDSSIAEKTGLSDKTVTRVRDELARRSEIPDVKTKKGKDGKKQAAKKPRARATPAESPTKPSPTQIRDKAVSHIADMVRNRDPAEGVGDIVRLIGGLGVASKISDVRRHRLLLAFRSAIGGQDQSGDTAVELDNSSVGGETPEVLRNLSTEPVELPPAPEPFIIAKEVFSRLPEDEKSKFLVECFRCELTRGQQLSTLNDMEEIYTAKVPEVPSPGVGQPTTQQEAPTTLF